MSIQAMTWVIEQAAAKGSTFVVLLMIANHAHADGTCCWASVGTLARESRITKRQAQRCIRQLERAGELYVEPGAGPNGTNLCSMPRYRRELRGVKMSPLAAVEKPVEKRPQGGQMKPRGGRKTTPKGVSRMSPEPSLEATVLKGNRHRSGGGEPLTAKETAVYNKILKERLAEMARSKAMR